VTRHRIALLCACLLGLGSIVGAGWAETFVWIDEHGVTHITDAASGVPESARTEGESLQGLWTEVRGEPLFSAPRPGRSDARTQRLIRGAVDDLSRGETARASAALEGILREFPSNPQAHWYLALLDRQRGRYDSTREHLQAFLTAAGDDLEPWRASARRRLEALADEDELADPATARELGPWKALSSDHFRVSYDPALGHASPDYAHTVLRYLEEARQAVGQRLGVVPEEAMGVVFYGKAAYLEAHRHRFSFQTIGFFDGRIHVVSAAHPAGELRALLFHEYSHAVFREQTGGDRPYWLNEGLAELSERASVNRTGLTRSERLALRGRIDAGTWLPLKRLAPSFSGLDDDAARAAYLESAMAAAWISARTNTAQRGRLLKMLGTGMDADSALSQVVGVDTVALDLAVREEVRDEFPPEFATEALRRAPAKLRGAAP
jgi:hypothetical protein